MDSSVHVHLLLRSKLFRNAVDIRLQHLIIRLGLDTLRLYLIQALLHGCGEKDNLLLRSPCSAVISLCKSRDILQQTLLFRNIAHGRL